MPSANDPLSPLRALLEGLVGAALDDPAQAEITQAMTATGRAQFRVVCQPRASGESEFGRLIGHHGATLQAIRRLLFVRAGRLGLRVQVDVVDGAPRRPRPT